MGNRPFSTESWQSFAAKFPKNTALAVDSLPLVSTVPEGTLRFLRSDLKWYRVTKIGTNLYWRPLASVEDMQPLYSISHVSTLSDLQAALYKHYDEDPYPELPQQYVVDDDMVLSNGCVLPEDTSLFFYGHYNYNDGYAGIAISRTGGQYTLCTDYPDEDTPIQGYAVNDIAICEQVDYCVTRWAGASTNQLNITEANFPWIKSTQTSNASYYVCTPANGPYMGNIWLCISRGQAMSYGNLGRVQLYTGGAGGSVNTSLAVGNYNVLSISLRKNDFVDNDCLPLYYTLSLLFNRINNSTTTISAGGGAYLIHTIATTSTTNYITMNFVNSVIKQATSGGGGGYNLYATVLIDPRGE